MAETFLHGAELLEIDSGSRPIQTVASAVIGVIGTAPRADTTAFPADTPVLVTNRVEAAKLLSKTTGEDGTLPDALDSIFDQAGAVVVVIRVTPGTDDAATMAAIVGSVSAATGKYYGMQGFIGAESALGVTPRILIAPGWTHIRPVQSGGGGYLANPVVAGFIGVAERLRAVVIADGPNTSDASAQAYADDFGSSRVYVVDPFALKLDGTGATVARPSSAIAAGLIAKSDAERGFWWSPSNQAINGIMGTARAVDFQLGDATSRANILNAANVNTIIRKDGFRLWGNRTLSADAKWQFLCVRRTADMINDSILRSHMWAVDRGITKNYVHEVVEGVNAYLRHLVAIGAIIGGKCWADPALNTPDQIALGKVYFDFDFTPVYPAEHIIFRSQLTNGYLSEIF